MWNGVDEEPRSRISVLLNRADGVLERDGTRSARVSPLREQQGWRVCGPVPPGFLVVRETRSRKESTERSQREGTEQASSSHRGQVLQQNLPQRFATWCLTES